MRKVYLAFLVIAMLSLCGCSAQGFLAKDFYIDQKTIDEAIVNISQAKDWCVGLDKITINNYRVGTVCNGAIIIHNGVDKDRTFSLSYAEPTRLKEGFSMPPYGSSFWVTITSPQVFVLAGDNIVIPIRLDIPEGTTIPKNWEFQILVEEKDNPSNIQIAYKQRWLISK
jgi:hypothetical protein